MANMIEVAKATVTIIPNMQGAQAKISQDMGAATKSVGPLLGDKMGGGMLSGLLDKLKGLKGALTKALPVAAAAAVGKALYDVGKTFDEMYDTVLLKTGATGEALASLNKSAKDLFATLPIDAAEAGEVIGEVNTRFGLMGDELEDVSAQFVKFAKVNDLDITSAVDSTQKAMAALGVSTDDTAAFLDTLNAVGQATGVDMNTLTKQLMNNASVLTDMGFSASDAANFVGMLDKAGVDSQVALNGFQRAMVNAAKEGKTTGQALKELQDLINSDASSQEKLNAMTDMFGTKAAPKMLAALESGQINFEALGTSMNDYAGNLDYAMEGTMDAAEHFQVLKNQLLRLVEPIATPVFDIIGQAVGFLADAFEAFYQGPAQVIGQAFSQIIEWVKGLIAVFTETFTTAAGFDGLGNTISTLGGIVSSVWHGVLEPLANLLINIAKVIIPPLVQIIGGTLGTAFNIIGGIISNVIQGIQNFIQAIKNIIEAVKTTVRKIKETIKLPHFSISGGFSLSPLSVPKLSIDWYDKGGVFYGPQIIGVGEKRPEYVGALDDLKGIVGEAMTENPGPITINVFAAEGQSAREIAAEVERRLIEKVKGRTYAWR